MRTMGKRRGTEEEGNRAENRSCRWDFKAAYAADDDEGGNRAETRGGGGSNQRIGKVVWPSERERWTSIRKKERTR